MTEAAKKSLLEPESAVDLAPRRSMVVPKSRGPVPGFEIASFSYRILRRSSASSDDTERFLAAYRCWQVVWGATLRELDGVDRVYADEFTRQDEVGALFHDEECIGMTCFRWVNLTLPPYQDDTYFKSWTAEGLQNLTAQGPRVCICSNLTVLPEWRGAAGHSIKETLTALSLHRFSVSNADVLTAVVRNDKNVNRLMYRFGAAPLQQNSILHGVSVDHVGFFHEQLNFAASEPELEFFARDLFEKAQESDGQ